MVYARRAQSTASFSRANSLLRAPGPVGHATVANRRGEVLPAIFTLTMCTRFRTLLLGSWLMLIASLACTRGSPPDSVVLVTIDTLRADHLGAYGYDRPTSPAIDAVARDATLFASASPTCPATAPSIASIMTGMHRASNRVIANGWVLPGEVETLSEVLKAHGLRTLGRVANPALGANLGFAQGFDDFAIPAGLERTGPGQFGGAPLLADVRTVLDGVGREPFFLWIHFMDPHGPYFPPAEYRALFSADDYRWPNEHDLPLGQTEYGLSLIPSYQVIDGQTSPADYRARYDGEIRSADAYVGAVVELLKARGLWDRAVFVLTADHGESMGEHSYYFQHGWYAYEDCLHVPLVVRAPGLLPPGTRVPQSVSLLDLAPTVLDLLGFPPGKEMEGQSLLPLLRGQAVDRAAFAQTYYGDGIVALREGALKYIYTPPLNSRRPQGKSDPPRSAAMREELYDLSSDPRELHDLAKERPDALRGFRTRVEQWLAEQSKRAEGRTADRPGQGTTPAGHVLGDPQLERQLRALGYVE